MKQAGGGGTISCVVQCFTANGTWSCCPGAVCIEVVTVAAGGGGRSGVTANSANPGRSLGGPGGGAGGISICTISAGIPTSACVIIGTSTANADGGNTCFGSSVISYGGKVGTAAFTANGTGTSSASGGAGGAGNQGTSPGGGSSQATAPGNGEPAPCISSSNTGSAGGACAGFPGGGGGGGSVSVCAFAYQGAAGSAGSGSTLCGITLGAGGTGSQGAGTANTGSSFGGGGGGGGKNYFDGCPGAGAAGGPGIVKVTQYILS